ncbi:enoyl-CoA hydratase/isomerase family protein [Fundicoccus sp. Sow4_D5]|uniref:enoyl-CoA hydratase/isomerase family protein n=1 Tax=Fundicoccus sp. Sow4_D5 TaxID=3438782 RepID=UPI003F92BFA6
MSKQLVKVTKEGHISYLSLDSPANLNAMGLGIVSDLLAALIEAEADPGTQVIVINSTGKFSAGGDLVSLNKQAKAQDADTLKELVEAVADVILYIKKMTKIVISSVNSAPAGAGFSLALASDMI